jgi:membrane protein implicated in regulation of membrane protease activity
VAGEHAPASTYVLVVGVMATFAAFGIVLIFTPPWYWYLIPLAFATPVIVILARRWAKRRAMKRELASTLSGL